MSSAAILFSGAARTILGMHQAVSRRQKFEAFGAFLPALSGFVFPMVVMGTLAVPVRVVLLILGTLNLVLGRACYEFVVLRAGRKHDDEAAD